MLAHHVTKAVLLMAFLSITSGCVREISFKQDISPILREHCLSCHVPGGEGFAASGFSVENYDALMKGTKLGPVIVAGSPASSTLVLLIEHKAHPSINMPRDKPPLLEKQIDVLRKWISDGAKNN